MTSCIRRVEEVALEVGIPQFDINELFGDVFVTDLEVDKCD